MKVEYFERRSSGERLEQVSRPRAGAWVHIYGMSLDAREVAQEFSLDANIVRDIADARELPRAEFKDGTEYIFVRLPVGAADAVHRGAPVLGQGKQGVARANLVFAGAARGGRRAVVISGVVLAGGFAGNDDHRAGLGQLGKAVGFFQSGHAGAVALGDRGQGIAAFHLVFAPIGIQA